jgi:hypothetical protein
MNTNENSSDGAESIYRANVSQIIRRCLELCNWTPLDTKQLARRAGIWFDALYPVVPLERLRECFDHAVQNHSENFPVGAIEILQAYRVLTEQHLSSAEAEARKNDLSQPKKCDMAHVTEEGEPELVSIWLPAKGQDVIMPCPNCRPKAFIQKRDDIVNNIPTQQPLAAVRQMSQEDK